MQKDQSVGPSVCADLVADSTFYSDCPLSLLTCTCQLTATSCQNDVLVRCMAIHHGTGPGEVALLHFSPATNQASLVPVRWVT